MKTRWISIAFVIVFLTGILSHPVLAIAPPWPPSYSPPVISNVDDSKSYSGFPATVTVDCEVTWDPNTISRYVWLYVRESDESSYTRYTMSYSHTVGSNHYAYTKTVKVNPWETVYYYIKAREIIDWDLISYDTTTSTYSVSPLTAQSYNKDPSDKWAVVIQCTKTSSGNDYKAHDDAYDDMKARINGFTGSADFPASHTKFLDVSGYPDEDIAHGEVIDALEFPKDNGADSNDFIFVYIVSHGEDSGLRILATRSSGGKLLKWSTIDNIFDNTNYDRLVIVLEACYSGTAITPLGGNDRLIITAADNTHKAKIDERDANDPYCPFSRKLIALVDDYPLGKAFYEAREYVYYLWENDVITGSYQNPSLSKNSQARISLGC